MNEGDGAQVRAGAWTKRSTREGYANPSPTPRTRARLKAGSVAAHQTLQQHTSHGLDRQPSLSRYPLPFQVFLTLLGDQSKTEEATDKVELDVQPDPDAPAGAAGKFMPGSRVVCKFKVPQLSFNITAATIDVEFPAGEGGKGWQVERMELRNVTWGSAPTAFFVDSK